MYKLTEWSMMHSSQNAVRLTGNSSNGTAQQNMAAHTRTNQDNFLVRRRSAITLLVILGGCTESRGLVAVLTGCLQVERERRHDKQR